MGAGARLRLPSGSPWSKSCWRSAGSPIVAPCYSYSDDVVRLETINSRRLWDLFGEARALGLPLVQSGRHSQPITFVPRAADVTIDVTRSEAGLRVEPRIGIESQRIPLQQSMLIGSPAHGIAWWDESTDRRRERHHSDSDLRRWPRRWTTTYAPFSERLPLTSQTTMRSGSCVRSFQGSVGG